MEKKNGKYRFLVVAALVGAMVPAINSVFNDRDVVPENVVALSDDLPEVDQKFILQNMAPFMRAYAERGQKISKRQMRRIRRKAAAGDLEAQRELASCYLMGIGCSQDVRLGIRWFKHAADKGDTVSCLMMGCLAVGGAFGTEWESKGVEWMSSAAESGNAVAQYMLSVIYSAGAVVPYNEDESKKWYDRAMAQNSPELKKQFESFRRTVDSRSKLGDPHMMFLMGVMKTTGYCEAEINEPEGVEWYRKAAAMGHDVAWLRLGECYECGVGVATDAVEAARCYRKAAELGNIEAQQRIEPRN